MLRPLMFVFLAGYAAAQPTVDWAALDAYVEKGLREWEIPGAAIAVATGDEILYARGYGVLEIGGEEPADERTVFAVASNTKLFTATALGLLVNEGKLEWESRPLDLVEGFEMHDDYATTHMTIRDLLCHRSGLGGNQGDIAAWGSDLTRREIIERLRYLEPVHGFRAGFGYSNSMFLVAGEAIPAVVDTSWDEFLETRIFAPLGMTRTTTSVEALEDMTNVARPHTMYDSAVVAHPYRNIDNYAPCGSINSTASDMIAWLQTQLNYGVRDGEQIIDSATIRETREPLISGGVGDWRAETFPHNHFSLYGLGVAIDDYRGRALYHHSGGSDGMLSKAGFMPEEDVAVVVLTNYDNQQFYDALFYYIWDRLLDAPEKDYAAIYRERFLENRRKAKENEKTFAEERIESAPPTLDLDAYAGTYENDFIGEVVVELNDAGALAIDVVIHPALEATLEHRHYDVFLAPWKDRGYGRSVIVFALGDDGKVESFKTQISFDSTEYEFTKRKD